MKYGLLGDAPFFAWLESNWQQIFSGEGAARAHAIATSCRAKAAIVEADEREESGTRALLNLGHTFGHALEAFAGYSDRLAAWRGHRHRHAACLLFLRRAGALPGERRQPCRKASRHVGLPGRIADILAACPRRKSCFSLWRRTRR